MVGLPTVSAGLGQYNVYALIVYVVVDGARSVAAAAYACYQIVGIVATDFLLQLPFNLFADHALHACHQVRVGVRSHGAAHDIECVGRMTAPVAYSLTACVAQCHVACAYWVHLGSQHLHALHVGVLSLHIGSTHKHLALHVHQRTHRSCGHTVLSGTCLGYDASLTHLLGQQYLSDGVVDFVRTGVVQVLALQVELTAILLAHTLGIVQRTGASHIVLKQCMILLLKLIAFDDWQISILQVVYTFVENLGHVSATKLSVKTSLISKIILHIS